MFFIFSLPNEKNQLIDKSAPGGAGALLNLF